VESGPLGKLQSDRCRARRSWQRTLWVAGYSFWREGVNPEAIDIFFLDFAAAKVLKKVPNLLQSF
jgi:hypothetical protein